MTFVSYAQNFEDVMLWRAFKDIERGFYIDLGAQDPVVDSVSHAFHERGWRGVHVEPSAHYAEMLREQRPGDVVIQAAISGSRELVHFFEIKGTGISTTSPAIAAQHRERGFETHDTLVPGIPLSTVLEACESQEVHWLKIDIEGSERAALESWGESSIRPLVVVVESTLPLTQTDSSHEWEHLLLQRGYQAVYYDGLNRYFVAKERRDLKAAFRTPPNVFDGFAVSGSSSSQIHSALDELRRREREVAATEAHSLRVELQDARTALVEQTNSSALVLSDALQRADDERERMTSAHRIAMESVREETAQRATELLAQFRDSEARLVGRLSEAAALQASAEMRLTELQTVHDRQVRDANEQVHLLLRQLSEREQQSATEHTRLVEAHQALELEARESRATFARQLESITNQFELTRVALLETHAETLRTGQARHATDIAELRELLARQASQINQYSGQLEHAVGTLQRVHRSLAGRVLSLVGRPVLGEPAMSDIAGVARVAAVSPSNEALAEVPKQRESEMLNTLLALNDVEFVRAAYRAALKRDPDPAGERNYLGLLRAGHDKLRLLGDMASSAEGRRTGAPIPGLRSALVWVRLGRIPIAGPFLRRTLGLLGRSPIPDPRAAYQQQLIGAQNATLDLVSQMVTSVRDLKRQQDELELAVGRLLNREDEVSVVLTSLQEQLTEFQPSERSVGSNRRDIGGVSMSSGSVGLDSTRDVQLQLMKKASAWKA